MVAEMAGELSDQSDPSRSTAEVLAAIALDFVECCLGGGTG
jgi:hypothetical protein